MGNIYPQNLASASNYEITKLRSYEALAKLCPAKPNHPAFCAFETQRGSVLMGFGDFIA
jgi:hypothetical protein